MGNTRTCKAKVNEIENMRMCETDCNVENVSGSRSVTHDSISSERCSQPRSGPLVSKIVHRIKIMASHQHFLLQRDAWCSRAAYNHTSASPDHAPVSSIDPSTIRALDGDASAPCRATTEAGVGRTIGGACVDLGVGNSGGRWRQLRYTPPIDYPPRADPRGESLRLTLDRLQHQGPGCSGRPAYTVAMLPTIGLCATIEYLMLALARSSSVGSRLVLGRQSTVVWTSAWLCGRERSLACYFNVSSSCCADEESFHAAVRDEKVQAALPPRGLKLQAHPHPLPARKLQKMRSAHAALKSRRHGNARAVSLGGELGRRFNELGSAWVHGQLVRWLFDRLWPSVRAEINSRRAAVLPPVPAPAPAPAPAPSPSRRSALPRCEPLPSPFSAHARPHPATLALTLALALALTPTQAEHRVRGAPSRCISLHVRRGDSCALGSRFCPANLTSAYFGAAAELRAQYATRQPFTLATPSPTPHADEPRLP